MQTYDQLRRTAAQLRIRTLQAIYAAQSGHPGGSLSICEILAVLYFRQMRIDPARPQDPDRDRFVLSKGHAAPAYYAALAERGFFDPGALTTLRQIDSFLQGHPARGKVPGVDMSTGSLGQGLSAANGMALAGRYDGRAYRVYCLCGDGELQEGQIWEAAMTAAHYRLDNLTLLVDVNGLQIDGAVEQVMDVQPLEEKFAAFGWSVLTVDGHDVEAVDLALQTAGQIRGRPAVLLCRTVKGKGVSYMENQAGWHGAAPNQEQYDQAMAELQRGVV